MPLNRKTGEGSRQLQGLQAGNFFFGHDLVNVRDTAPDDFGLRIGDSEPMLLHEIESKPPVGIGTLNLKPFHLRGLDLQFGTFGRGNFHCAILDSVTASTVGLVGIDSNEIRSCDHWTRFPLSRNRSRIKFGR